MTRSVSTPRLIILFALLIALLFPTITAHATAPTIQLAQVQNDGTTVTLIGTSDTTNVSDVDIIFSDGSSQYSLRDDANGTLSVDANGVLTATLSSADYESFFPTSSSIIGVEVVNIVGDILFSGSINGGGGGGVGLPQ